MIELSTNSSLTFKFNSNFYYFMILTFKWYTSFEVYNTNFGKIKTFNDANLVQTDLLFFDLILKSTLACNTAPRF